MPNVAPDEGRQSQRESSATQIPRQAAVATQVIDLWPEVYLPAGQSMHVALSAEADPTGPYLPAAHAEPEQVEAPDSLEYVPAVQ